MSLKELQETNKALMKQKEQLTAERDEHQNSAFHWQQKADECRNEIAKIQAMINNNLSDQVTLVESK